MQDSLPESPQGADEAEGLETVMGFVSVAMRWFTTSLSLGLVIVIVFWAYRLGVRDASELPVIRAMNEPARTRPEDPGGMIAENQGLEVNEVLAGQEAGTPGETQTAPPPVFLTDEDVPSVDPKEPQEEVALAIQPEADDPLDTEDPREDDPIAAFDPFADVSGRIDNTDRPPPRPEDLNQPAISFTDDGQAEREQAAARQREEAERIARQREETARREQAAQEQQSRDPEVARREQEAREIQEALERALRDQQPATATTASTAPNPNVRIQLGSFDTEIGALGYLETLTSVHGDLLASRRISVQKVTSGNRVEYRIRASGFRSAGETAALCQALRARGVDCVQVGG
jgi:SPOR domain